MGRNRVPLVYEETASGCIEVSSPNYGESALARRFGVTHSAVGRAMNYQTWRVDPLEGDGVESPSFGGGPA